MTQPHLRPRPVDLIKAGKRSMLTPELTQRLSLYLRRGHYLETAARLCSVSPVVVDIWRDKGKAMLDEEGQLDSSKVPYPGDEIYAELYLATELAIAEAEHVAVEAWQDAFEDDWKAAQRYLSIRHRQRWSEQRLEQEAVQPSTFNITITARPGLTIEAEIEQDGSEGTEASGESTGDSSEEG